MAQKEGESAFLTHASRQALRVHRRLMACRRHFNGRVYLSQKQIAGRLGISPKTVKRAVRELRLLGVWQILRTNKEKGRHMRNRYELTPQFELFCRPNPVKNVPSKKLKALEPRTKPMYTGHGLKRPHNPKPKRCWIPKGPFSWAVDRAIRCAGHGRWIPLYLKFRNRLGDDRLAMEVRDVEDDERGKAYSDRPIRCRGAYLTARLIKVLEVI